MASDSDFDFLLQSADAAKPAEPAPPVPEAAAPVPVEFIRDWRRVMSELQSIPGLNADGHELPTTELAWILFLGELAQRRRRSELLRANWTEARNLAVRKFASFYFRSTAPKTNEEIRETSDRFVALIKRILGDEPTTPAAGAAGTSTGAGAGRGTGRGTGESENHRRFERPRGG